MKNFFVAFFILILFSINSYAENNDEKIDSPEKTYKGIDLLYSRYSCPVELTEMKTDIDKQSMESWSLFETRIKDGIEAGVNFAGKYIIIEWGGGTECQTGVIVDASSGKIYEIPTSAWGKEYKADSCLLIVNPPVDDEEEEDRPDYALPAYYKWENNTFILLHDISLFRNMTVNSLDLPLFFS